MDKLIKDGGRTTISNDGATLVKLLDIVHPAAKTLVNISMSQDAEVSSESSKSLFWSVKIRQPGSSICCSGCSLTLE